MKHHLHLFPKVCPNIGVAASVPDAATNTRKPPGRRQLHHRQIYAHTSNSPARHRTGGFTLLEMLAAAAVMGILVVLLFETFNQGSRGWEIGVNRVETSQGARTAFDLLARDLTQAIGTTNLPFDGTATDIQFWSPVNARGYEDICKVHYFLSNSSPKCLVREEFWMGSGTATNQSVISENIWNIEFTYYGGTMGTNKFTNYSSASYSSSPPSSVEITITNFDSRTAIKPQGIWTNYAKVFVLRVSIPNGNRRPTP